MIDFKRRLVTGIATGALLLNGFAPLAFADTTIQITGNGSSSDNTANITSNQTSSVIQNNVANVTNNVDVDANTGGNKAEDNTGGNVTVETGDSSVNTTLNNAVNSNQAKVECCETGNTTVLIGNNGSESDNNANLDQTTSTQVWQNNTANVTNNVDVHASTGDNSAEDNTGGNVKIDTGKSDVTTKVSTLANANVAQVGGNGKSGDLSLKILDNGSNSDNNIDLDVDRSVVVGQENDANVTNNVNVDANTGNNEAEDNTGGNAEIKTGDASVNTTVDNMVNFNAADVDCGGCLFGDVLAKIDNNGTDTDNNIDASLSFNEGKEEGTYQMNDARVNNKLYDQDARTGDNTVEDNTAEGDGDPSIDSGDSDVKTNIKNTVNTNGVGDETNIEWPKLDVSVTVNLHDLLAFLGLSS